EEEAQPSPHRPRPTPLRRAVRDAPRRRVLHGSEHPWGAHHDRRLTPHTHPRAGSKTHPASRSLTLRPRHHDPQQEPSLLLTKNIGTPPPGTRTVGGCSRPRPPTTAPSLRRSVPTLARSVAAQYALGGTGRRPASGCRPAASSTRWRAATALRRRSARRSTRR